MNIARRMELKYIDVGLQLAASDDKSRYIVHSVRLDCFTSRKEVMSSYLYVYFWSVRLSVSGIIPWMKNFCEILEGCYQGHLILRACLMFSHRNKLIIFPSLIIYQQRVILGLFTLLVVVCAVWDGNPTIFKKLNFRKI